MFAIVFYHSQKQNKNKVMSKKLFLLILPLVFPTLWAWVGVIKKHIMLWLFVFPLLGGAGVGYAQGCFGPATNFAAGTAPQSVVMADFNNDSKVDLAVANSGSNNVSVFLGDGAGSFTTTLTFAVGTHPISVISAYLDNDGFPDLAVANYNSNNVSVLIGDGTGNFAAAVNYAVGSYPISITSTYLLSGYMDLAVANVSSNNVSILKNYGNGYFATATNYTVGAQPISITNADFNGDGYKDLVTANYSANNVSVLFGASTGGFATATNFAVGTNPKSVISDDFNGDSKADLAVANYNSNGVSILLGTGSGSFSAATNFSLGTYPTSIISDYFNADAFIDLAVANYTSNNVSVMLGDGAGSFGAFGVAGNFAVGTGPISITRADFNGDGKADIATANYGSNDVSILFGAPLPTVTANASGTTVCSGTSVILTGGGAVTYGWTGGVSDGFAFPVTSTQTYTVTGTDGNGCNNTAVVTINLSTPSTPNICMVTSDSLSVNNILYWDKIVFANVQFFNDMVNTMSTDNDGWTYHLAITMSTKNNFEGSWDEMKLNELGGLYSDTKYVKGFRK